MRAHKEMRGFEYLIYSAFSFCLISVLLLLPLAPAFADELINQGNEAPRSNASEQGVQIPSIPEAGQGEVENISGTDAPVAGVDTIGVTVEPVVADAELPVSDVAPVSEIVDTPVADESTSDESPIEDTTVTDTEVISHDATTTDAVATPDTVPDTSTVDDVVVNVSEVATTTQEQESAPEEVNVVNVVTNDENKFTFSKDECTTVGDGTFYCATPTEKPQIQNTDRIFSALDEEGDKEIYVEKSGELSALTNNQVDDDAPYFDEVSNTAVWQRLIEGRYQIIQYDFGEETEKQLTYDSFNNMQPSVFGDTVVWQGWVGSDWEIFMSVDSTVTMLTDNTIHDIAPSVNGTHIVWQSFEGDVWRVKVYDLRTGLTDTVSDSGGGSIENPRFVLVYDAKMETGDIETRGYDLKSGEVVDLASKPTPVPEEIPDPDQTGEKRALVSPSTQPKQKTDSDESDDVGTTTNNGIDDGDIVIPSFELPSEEPVVTDATSTPAGTVDILVPSFENSATSTDTEHIEDLVVEPYIPFEDTLEE